MLDAIDVLIETINECGYLVIHTDEMLAALPYRLRGFLMMGSVIHGAVQEPSLYAYKRTDRADHLRQLSYHQQKGYPVGGAALSGYFYRVRGD